MKGPLALTVVITQDGDFVGRAGCYLSPEFFHELRSNIDSDTEETLLECLIDELRHGLRRALRSIP